MSTQELKQRWFFLFIATLTQVSMAVIHLGIPALIPLIQGELKLSRTEVGLPTGAFLGIVALPPIFGFIVDQSNSYRLAWIGLAGMILAALSVLSRIQEEHG